MARTFIVKHPDGTVSKRTTANRDYPFAVVQEITRQHRIVGAESSVEHIKERLAQHEAALADGKITEERQNWSRGATYVSLYVGGEFAGSYVEGEKERPSDDALRAKVQESIESIKRNLAQAEQAVEKAHTSPEVTYGVLRWTSRYDLAHKAASGEFGKGYFHANGNKVYVSTTEEVVKVKR